MNWTESVKRTFQKRLGARILGCLMRLTDYYKSNGRMEGGVGHPFVEFVSIPRDSQQVTL